MESKCLPDRAAEVPPPPVPIETYEWEELRRSREAGGYPWTHLLKPGLQGVVTAEDVLRESTPAPRRSMSRELSRERSGTRSPDAHAHAQRILNLDSSPGSSRKIGEDGERDSVHVPNFSKEVSLDSEDDPIKEAVDRYVDNEPKEGSNQCSTPRLLAAPPTERSKNISPKSILKRRVPVQPITKISETKDNTKCCHPLVNKIKHMADKTLHKHDKTDINKSPNIKRKKQKEEQTIVQLKSSPGAVRRQQFGAIKLGDSDEMSKTLSMDVSPPTRKKRDHIYEDIEQIEPETERSIQFSPKINDNENSIINNENESISENKSNGSQDPSLYIEEEEDQNLRPEEHIMESLHKHNDIEKEALVLEVDSEEPDIEDVIENQLNECFEVQGSPNITITEIIDDDNCTNKLIPQPKESEEDVAFGAKIIDVNEAKNDWSKSNSDHEYEIIGPQSPPNIVFTTPSVDQDNRTKPDDELSSTTSLERKYLQHDSDDDDHQNDRKLFDDRMDIMVAEALQKDIEDQYFVSTPSTVSRTECEISTSQVDSSALENLPLKRDSRTSADVVDSKLHQRFKEQTGKLKNQAGKLKTKLQNIKAKQFSLPDKSRFKLPQMPERTKFTIPDRRKFSLPERPKFKKNYISEKLSMGDRKKFTLPDRPKFTMPDLPKFKIPERAKIHFSSLGRKKDCQVDPDSTESSEDIKNIAKVEFESRTYPRFFNRKKKNETLATSSPTLNREETPPPVFSFAKVSKKSNTTKYFESDELVEPREYGNLPRSSSVHQEEIDMTPQYDTEYDFDKLEQEYDEENRRFHEALKKNKSSDENTSSLPDISSSNPECTHVINEINNDEFFVRPKGISHENIEVRQYLSDEIREAFKMPSNSLSLMGGNVEDDIALADVEGEDADPELYSNDESEKLVSECFIDKDDGYYTFPPVRPSRAKRMKKQIQIMDDPDQSIQNNINSSIQFSDVDIEGNNDLKGDLNMNNEAHFFDEKPHSDSDEVKTPVFNSQTLPTAPKRKNKSLKSEISLTSLNDLREKQSQFGRDWTNHPEDTDDIIVYRTEHEYIVPETQTAVWQSERSPVPPRRSRNRSRSSHGTSFADDDRTSRGAESLILDPHVSPPDHAPLPPPSYREERQESPGYATVDKYPTAKARRSKSKTPPPKKMKSHSSERKYYTVDRLVKESSLPDRPPRKKSSTSLMTLDSFHRGISSGDVTQYVEIDDLDVEDINRDLHSGEIINKMKDRPLPPPPRPPRGPKRSKLIKDNSSYTAEGEQQNNLTQDLASPMKIYSYNTEFELNNGDEVVEIEVSTQTDPLPDDIDYELGLDEHCDLSMTSSLHDIAEDDTFLNKSQNRLVESPRGSRPASRSDKSLVPTDPKIQDLSKTNHGRTSPTVILVERRVSSPTRINEREEIVTEASLTVQPIEIEESAIPDVPPLPRAEIIRPPRQTNKRFSTVGHENALERLGEVEQGLADVQLDNLVTQRLQVRDLDVGRLNVSELQASKILVSEIEGMTLQVTELDSKSGHISVSGIELSPSVIDEIVKKFAELATTHVIQSGTTVDVPRPVSREEQTQTEEQVAGARSENTEQQERASALSTPTAAASSATSEQAEPPLRPPPPDLSPLLYSYLQDLSIPPASFYHLRAPRERPFTDFFESQISAPPPPPPPARRAKRRPAQQRSESSSDEEARKPSPRRAAGTGMVARLRDPSVLEAGAQFLRVCHGSVSRVLRGAFRSLVSYVSGIEDKRDVQMALVIFLVLVAGLIMFGLSDGRTVHHHHWEFFNPPDANNQ